MSAAESPVLEMIAAEEQAALATGAVARRLVTAHADLPIDRVSLRYLGEVHVHVPHAGAVRAWAARLEASVDSFTQESQPGVVFEHHRATAYVANTRVAVRACRLLPDAEAAAWCAAQGGGAA
ncbi:hypothetical protein JJV70_06630 [Streptomyces sp. JJ66]|uniref:hypothetical protein n=1 Tax=Streptomyces sp. JJ66 TaxID=2803843 RepID=UPI001C5669B3|nr:hypothetical protein [Streptomyces sp. JJ66]MBW1601791.1 hypothetical protein [Streptomyces sp. JJ66]